jgi:hypothetical protein
LPRLTEAEIAVFELALKECDNEGITLVWKNIAQKFIDRLVSDHKASNLATEPVRDLDQLLHPRMVSSDTRYAGPSNKILEEDGELIMVGLQQRFIKSDDDLREQAETAQKLTAGEGVPRSKFTGFPICSVCGKEKPGRWLPRGETVCTTCKKEQHGAVTVSQSEEVKQALNNWEPKVPEAKEPRPLIADPEPKPRVVATFTMPDNVTPEERAVLGASMQAVVLLGELRKVFRPSQNFTTKHVMDLMTWTMPNAGKFMGALLRAHRFVDLVDSNGSEKSVWRLKAWDSK